MKEVLEFEDIIRRALPRARDEAPGILVRDADAIMNGRPTEIVGTRKERLRYLAEQLKAYLPIEKAANPAEALPQLLTEIDHDDDMFDDDDDGECSHNKRGHSFVIQEGFDIIGEGRTYCEHCLADGDA